MAVAVEYGYEDIVKWLVESGADVNAMIQVDYSAAEKWPFDRFVMERPLLSYAHSISIKLLVSSGASPDWGIAEKEGISAVQYSAGYQSIEILKELIRLGGDVHAPAAALMGRTALQEACGAGSLEKVKLIVEKYGVNVNEPRAERVCGVTSLEQAVFFAARKIVYDEPGENSKRDKRGMVDMEDHETIIKSSAPSRSHLEFKEGSSSMEVVKYLLRQGANITPNMLHLAAAVGNWALAELLLREGADPYQRGYVDGHKFRLGGTMVGRTVLQFARLNHRDEFAVQLQKWMHEHPVKNSE